MSASVESQRGVREMLNAHLLPVLAVVGAVCAVSGALSLASLGRQADRWSRCYDISLSYLIESRPQLRQHADAIAANFCNGGRPIGQKPGAS